MILYEGPSLLDGKPIVVIATGIDGRSSNEKTGAMVQTWILRSDISPVEATHTGDDASVCGDCKHRGVIVDGRNQDRSCYVTVFQAPLVVWKTYKAGKYARATIDDLAAIGEGKIVRLGSYGDPAAVPFEIWERFASGSKARTGYTHQWRVADNRLSTLCMASCDSEEDLIEARAMGYRSFRVRRSTDPVLPREVICPASKEANYKTTCALCKACGGTSAKAKADIVIVAHGAASKINAFNRAA